MVEWVLGHEKEWDIVLWEGAKIFLTINKYIFSNINNEIEILSFSSSY